MDNYFDKISELLCSNNEQSLVFGVQLIRGVGYSLEDFWRLITGKILIIALDNGFGYRDVETFLRNFLIPEHELPLEFLGIPRKLRNGEIIYIPEWLEIKKKLAEKQLFND